MYLKKGEISLRTAYDIILSFEVSAELAAQSGGFEPYRYECAYCGEEVYIAAPYSTRMVAHFRHRSGNNDVECENYLGQYGMISNDSRSRRSNRERVEFYYENGNKTFSLGIRFSESEIQGYEQNNVDFEIRTKDSDTPFCVLRIDGTNFTPDVPTLILLNKFSYSYYLSNSLGGTKREYDSFHREDSPTFFKIQGHNNDFNAKLVRSTVLFTNTEYFVALQSQYSTPRGIQFPRGINVEQTFLFETMNRKFLGIVLTISNKTVSIESLLNTWGYQLEDSETLTLLWPPAPEISDVNVITSDYAYIFSSFELKAHGNINVQSEDVVKFHHGISRVAIKPKTKIFKKNTEMVIDKVETSSENYDAILQTKSTVSNFTVPETGSYFLYNRSGVSSLKGGQVVFLTPSSLVIKYEGNYPISFIYPYYQKELSGEELLVDILAHYKRTEAFDPAMFKSLVLSKTVSQYIAKCREVGSINLLVKQFIEEGRL
jgi:hypothetical protein